jgi:hypothetical protein
MESHWIFRSVYYNRRVDFCGVQEIRNSNMIGVCKGVNSKGDTCWRGDLAAFGGYWHYGWLLVHCVAFTLELNMALVKRFVVLVAG